MQNSRHWIPLVATLACVGSASAQVVECTLAHSGDIVKGECMGAAVELRAGISGEPQWLGTLAVADTLIDIDVIAYDYETGPTEVFRTPWGWFIPTRLDLAAEPPELAWSMAEEAPPSRADLEVLSRARALIPTEEDWDRADDRVCSPTDTTYSLYCALAEATRAVDGTYQHRQPALQAVRRIIGERWPDRIVEHRLMDFNNDSRTTLDDLRDLFDRAEDRLLETFR